MDWGELLANPVAFGAVTALVGIVIGHLTTGWGRRKEYGLSALSASVQVLQTEHDRLSKKVESLEKSVDWHRGEYLVIKKKYTVAVAYIGTLQTLWDSAAIRWDEAGCEYGEFPPVPELIVGDLEGDQVIHKGSIWTSDVDGNPASTGGPRANPNHP